MDLNNTEVIYEYQQMLLGKTPKMHASFFPGEGKTSTRNALTLLKYVAEEFLHWSPIDMYHKFNQKIAHQFRLDKIIHYITLPPEVNHNDYFVYATLLYPQSLGLNKEKLTLLAYKKNLADPSKHMPREFYKDEFGKTRAEMCLRYALSQNESFSSIRQMYIDFTTKAGYIIIKRNKLFDALGIHWASPVDYLHDALGQNKSELWYHVAKLYSTMKIHL